VRFFEQSDYDLGMEFEWDESKATANLKKHGVSFEEAKTVFDNVLAVIFDDEAHSLDGNGKLSLVILAGIGCCWLALLNVPTPFVSLVPV